MQQIDNCVTERMSYVVQTAQAYVAYQGGAIIHVALPLVGHLVHVYKLFFINNI